MAIQKKHYDIEKQGQCDFFDNYRIDYQGDASILVDNTDGVYHGNIMEFKLNISNTGKVLFQAIKYLSRMRVKGESIPARILLIDLNATKVYVYNSADYIDDIQKVYVGAASKGNDAFAKDITPVAEYDYMDMVDSAEVQKLLINKDADWYIPIDLDEDCIVGWAERYYREIPKATKGDFLGDGTGKINLNGEIRDPKHFVGLINPYTEPTNEKFKYLMDCLNDRLNKKDLGAFYTPEPYCQKAAELVEMAVARVPDGNDYIILDRCAGTGNLESALYGRYDKNGDELISHCVVSAYEYYEYKVLLERIGQDVRNIIPPTEANVVYENGKVSNADAMSKDYIDNPLIKQYVDNPNCTIILFENPPYRDDVSDNSQKRSDVKVREPFVQQEFKKVLPTLSNSNISTARDLSNQFIWSGFNYYLRQPTDSYILFSPIKYWKSLGLACKKFEQGYLFNRNHFHASASALACILWSNEDDIGEKIIVPVFDIKDDSLVFVKDITLQKCHNAYSVYFDKAKRSDDTETSVYFEYSGYEALNRKCDGKSYCSDNIIGYLRTDSFSIDAKHVGLVRGTLYGIRGFYLRRENYLRFLPLFAGKTFSQENWYDRDIYFTTSDGGDAYTKDKVFLKSCLIYTCLSNQNKCLSFTGSDGRYYRNELCFDTTNGDTVASADLATMTLDAESKKLMALWENILTEAKKTVNYNPKLTYGVYQITKELNTSHEEGTGTSKKTVYDYPNLNSYLVSLRDNLKEYYKSHITDKMFKYELLK
jgi:hypothetical protein